MRRTRPLTHMSEPARLDEKDVRCPVCGAAMLLLANKKRGTLFWSCVFQPSCLGKRRLP